MSRALLHTGRPQCNCVAECHANYCGCGNVKKCTRGRDIINCVDREQTCLFILLQLQFFSTAAAAITAVEPAAAKVQYPLYGVDSDCKFSYAFEIQTAVCGFLQTAVKCGCAFLSLERSLFRVYAYVNETAQRSR